MSEKRFELRSYGNDDEIWEMKDKQGESLLTWEDIEKKLNQLAEENSLLQDKVKLYESGKWVQVEVCNELHKKIDGLSEYMVNLGNDKQELEDMNKKLKESNTILRSSRKSCEKGRIQDRKSFESFDKMRLRRIRFLERRLSENGLSYYENEDAQGNRIV